MKDNEFYCSKCKFHPHSMDCPDNTYNLLLKKKEEKPIKNKIANTLHYYRNTKEPDIEKIMGEMVDSLYCLLIPISDCRLSLVKRLEKMKDLMPDLIEEYFPKGKCKERGKAMVLLTMFYLDIIKSIKGDK